MISSATTHHLASAYLGEVSTRLTRLLNRRVSIYLTDNENTYKIRVYGVRVSPNDDLLEVNTCTGWSSVWYSERLIDGYGDILFESIPLEEFDTELLDCLVRKIGVFSDTLKIREVF